jgi:adenosylhomocysteine nucleosidase
MPEFPPIVVTFARPEESRGLRRRLGKLEKIGSLGVGTMGGIRLAVVHTGIGPAAAEKAMDSLGALGTPRQIIGGGFAGALGPGLAIGHVVSDTRAANEPRRIVSRALPVESVEAKAALHRETGALAVDMETETIGAWCAQRGVAFTAVRAVSDTAQEALPVPFAVWFDVGRQRARVFRLLGWLAWHPGRMGAFARFVGRLKPISEKLADGIEDLLRREKGL